MARIAYIMLCHKDPDAIIAQARQLTAKGDFLAIHFDARAGNADFERIRSQLSGNKDVVFAKREKCGWGEWSLVQATLNAVTLAESSFPTATHFYMVSGDCMPIKSAEYAHEFLDASATDYIESFDYFKSGWIKTGMQEERLIYRHFFNERKNKWLFYTSMEWQKRLKLERAIPQDLEMMIGSQWWCLRRRTIEKVLEFIAKRPDIVRFFKTTWIPDETFFQTLVRHLVPYGEIDSRSLTFLMFSDYGMPVTFYNDQYDLLLSQDYLFARKISPDAHELKSRLGALYASGKTDFVVSNEGRTLYQYLAGQGRHGRRFAPRFWERESTLGRERDLLLVVCKKWHVAKRLVASIRGLSDLHGVDYLFDEDNVDLPDLGGIETSREKRSRHRRAMMRMLFDYYETNRMIICLDPSNIDLMQDFYSDRCTTRILEVECRFSDDYLIGHARRVGLAGDKTAEKTLMHILPTIRQDFAFEQDALRDEGFAQYYRISETASAEENAVPLSQFLGVSQDKATEIAHTPHLFAE
jgi:hypothetical protein